MAAQQRQDEPEDNVVDAGRSPEELKADQLREVIQDHEEIGELLDKLARKKFTVATRERKLGHTIVAKQIMQSAKDDLQLAISEEQLADVELSEADDLVITGHASQLAVVVQTATNQSITTLGAAIDSLTKAMFQVAPQEVAVAASVPYEAGVELRTSVISLGTDITKRLKQPIPNRETAQYIARQIIVFVSNIEIIAQGVKMLLDLFNKLLPALKPFVF